MAARRQLLAAGVSQHAVDGRLRSGLLTALYPGVYAVGCPTPAPAGAMWAALLAGGATAALSHDSAAWRLDWLGRGPTWHVTRAGRGHRLPGLLIHGARSLDGPEIGWVDGVRCTSPARTLIDVAASHPRRVVERCLDEWQLQGDFDAGAVLAAARRGRHGSTLARQLVSEHAAGTTLTRSQLEERFLHLCRRRGIPMPRFNVPMTLPSGTPIVVDAWWPEERVAIELDGRAAHERAGTFESDRARDLELHTMGVVPGRVTWRMLTRQPGWVERTVRALLDRRLGIPASIDPPRAA